MGEFTKKAKPGGGYYLLFNGKYVLRQTANEEWIRFETQDANFDPDYFEVMDNDVDRNTARAKFLTYNGNYVLSPTGNPYIVPYTFDFEAFIEKYNAVAGWPTGAIYLELAKNFYRGGIDDLQRSYDGSNNRSPFMSFTAGANLVYGVASSLVGLSVDDSLFYGGRYNRLGGKNPGPELGNNPNNPQHIKRGYEVVNSLRTPTSRFNKADTNNTTYDFTVNSPTYTRVDPNHYYLEFDIKSGDGWDTLETIYGPEVRGLSEYGTIQSPGDKRFQIKITGEKLAELYYSGKLRPGDKGFAIIGNGGVLSDLSAHFGEEITADSLAAVNKTKKDFVNTGQHITVFSVPLNNTNPASNDNISAAISSKGGLNALTSAAFEQRWQYNFQTILGPTNPAFIHSGPIDGHTSENNPNGVLWNVNAAGTPTIEDFNKYVEQQRVIESATNQTITELLNDSDNLQWQNKSMLDIIHD